MKVERMIDKEKLLEVKSNLEEQAAICSKAVEDACREKEEEVKRYDRIIENRLLERKKNEVLLILVNNELRVMEEVEKVKFEPWRKKVIDKAFEEFHQEHEPKIEDGLTDHMIKDKEYTFEEFEEKVLDPSSEVFKKIQATDKGEPGTSKHYLIMNELKKDLALKKSSLQRHTEGMTMVNASARSAEEMESVDTFTKVIERLVNTKPLTQRDESNKKLSKEISENLSQSLEIPSDVTVTNQIKKVRKQPSGYDSVTAKIKEGKELDPFEVNSLFKPCYEIECAIADILSKHKTLKLKDIVYFVEQCELNYNSKHIYNYVQSILKRSERFEKIGYGNWRLKKEELNDKGGARKTEVKTTSEEDSIDESTVLSIVRPKWNGVISYVDKLGVVNKIQQK
jgi:hypothetical protein